MSIENQDIDEQCNLTLGKAWKQRRLERRLSQADLAFQVGVSQPTVSLWESGRGVPEPKLRAALAKVLGYSNKHSLMRLEPEEGPIDLGPMPVTFEQTVRKTPDPIPAGEPPVATFEQFFAHRLVKAETPPQPVQVTLTHGTTTVSVNVLAKLTDVLARVLGES